MKEHEAMGATDETALKWSQEDYVREEMAGQHRALEEIAAQRRRREEGGIVILDDNDKEASGPSTPHIGDAGQGCNSNGGDDTMMYRLLDM